MFLNIFFVLFIVPGGVYVLGSLLGFWNSGKVYKGSTVQHLLAIVNYPVEYFQIFPCCFFGRLLCKIKACFENYL